MTKNKSWALGMNAEQMQAIEHTEGPCALIAQPGSGKTRALVHRIARMVDDGIDEDKICAVTFAKKAADEMNARVKTLDVKKAQVSTWHSLCLKILKVDRTEWADWEVDKRESARYIVKDVLSYKHLNWRGADLSKVCNYISLCKANLYGSTSNQALELAEEFFGDEAENGASAYYKYQQELAIRRLLTFDDFLVYAWLHLQDEQVRQQWASRWSYLLVDEAQDNNFAQKSLQELLARDHRNIMVVGDVAQAIYGFRGSTPDFLAGFAKEWSGRTIFMNRNYRSGKAIVDFANDVIRPAPVRAPTDMIAEREEAGDVQFVSSEDFDDEGSVFTSWIARHLEQGHAFSDCICLYRTNAQSRALEESLIRRRMPYLIVGGHSFYDRREVRDLLAYVRLALGRDPLESIKRCINTPFRFLGRAFVDRVIEAWNAAAQTEMTVSASQVVRSVAEQTGLQRRQIKSATDWAQLIEWLTSVAYTGSDHRPSDVLSQLVERTDYLDWVEAEEGQETTEHGHGSNVQEMIRTADRFKSCAEMLDYVDSTIRAAAATRSDKQPGGNRVLLMNIHKSKGLEWPHVFIAGCNDGLLPHRMAEELEEERRLLYVAATRARDSLTVSYVKSTSGPQGVGRARPSRFLPATVSDAADVPQIGA